MSEAITEQKPPARGSTGNLKHGHVLRLRRIREHGLRAIDGRTQEGRDALAWRAAAQKTKGGASCPHWLKTEIKMATFDLWRLLCLQTWLIADTAERGTVINKRHRTMPTIHDEYDRLDAKFMKRVEALDLGKVQPMDLASRLQLAQRLESNGATKNKP